MPSKKRSSAKDQSIDYKFDKDEKVLVLPAKHGEDIYEAKVLDRKGDKSKQPQYKIHYKGWNKRWDEWVDQRRLLKINASNVQIMSEKNSQNKQLQQQKKQQLKQQQQHESNHDDCHHSNHSKSPSPSRKRKLHQNHHNNNRKKRKLNANEQEEDEDDDDDDDDEENQNHSDVENKVNDNDNDNDNDNEDDIKVHGDGDGDGIPLEIKLPTKLKRKLITDWENITKKNLLIDLPRNDSERISQILLDFEECAIKTGQDRNLVIEISRGIKDYFNQALQVTLLYKLERKQHDNVIDNHPQLSMDQIYGVEHLCRLFVKLPQLLSPNDLDSDTRQILTAQIDCIIKFIIKNEDKYFCTNYIQS